MPSVRGVYRRVLNPKFRPDSLRGLPSFAVVVVNGTATPAVVAAVASTPAVTAQGAAVASPAAVAAVSAQPAITGVGNALTAPAVVAAVTSTPAVTARGAAIAAPSVVAALAAFTDLPTTPLTGTAASNTTGADVTVAVPVGTAAGDILLLAVETRDETPSTPAGWSPVADSPQTTTGTGDDETTLTLFWTRSGGFVSDPVVSIGGSGHHLLAAIVAIRGAASYGNPWDVTSAGFEDTADGSFSIPGDTTTGPNRLVIVIASAGAAEEEIGVVGSWANADLGDVSVFSSPLVNHSSPAWSHNLWFVTGTKQSAGAYGATTASTITNMRKAYITVAILPQVTAAVGTAVAMPAVVAAVAAVPAVTAIGQQSATATPAVVAALAAQPAVTAKGAAIAAPSVVSALASTPAVTVLGTAVATPSVVGALASVPAVTAKGIALATPSVVAALASQPAVTAKGTAVALPAVVVAIAAQPPVTALGTTPATASPAVVAAIAAVGAVTGVGTAVASPATVAALANVDAVIARGAAVASPSVVGAIGSVPPVTALAAAVASPLVVAGIASVPPVTVTGSGVATPAVVAVIAAINQVLGQGAAVALPSVVAAIAAVPDVIAIGTIGFVGQELIVILVDSSRPVVLREHYNPITLMDELIRAMSVREYVATPGIVDSDKSRVTIRDE